MKRELLETLLEGASETDSVEFKGPMAWSKSLIKDVLALANTVDGGHIIIGVEDESFARIGLTSEQVATFNSDIMRDQVAPYADPRAVFSVHSLADVAGRTYIVIAVSPFDEFPVICKRDGHGMCAGDIYFRSRVARPASARIAHSNDMREVIEASIARRARNLKRIGLLPEVSSQEYDDELGGL